MRFTYFISAFLATFAIASPISSSIDVTEGADLATRADKVVNTPEYQALAKVHPSLKVGEWYWVYQKDKLGAEILDGDTETLSELQQLQKNLGFEHIGVIVGQVKSTKKPTKKDGTTTTNHFEAVYYHMTMNKDKKNAAMVHSPNWVASKVDFSKSFLEDGGTTTKKGSITAKNDAKDYTNDEKHKTYSVTDNNCNTFAQYIRAALT
ncbi:uncharacterized protein F4807DRAFT_460752 [Annulohypoxylon truncatum]|uniref:uncharacterized protein n=1 Tax=Annulohypoxylon truncatum TaxID=327061 RepID=UPI0020087AC5|nr:uncharacterized protein F4807DRAFT_460752 [Annulohypoxylon truncatum]KAI1209535.1 hypothetical protein F4807DRAFT_460752 [Annulohypoxylon truncatum]